MIGRTLGHYRITEQIGMGGMATVYKAYDPDTDRYVAIKVLPEAFAIRGEGDQRVCPGDRGVPSCLWGFEADFKSVFTSLGISWHTLALHSALSCIYWIN